MKRLAIFISGRGSNLKNIIENKHNFNATIELVFSDKKDAFGLNYARENNIKIATLNKKDFSNKIDFDKELLSILRNNNIDSIILAGYMKILSPLLIKEYKNNIINIHPALLPAFTGLDAQKQALEYGAKITGATVHFVDEGVDTGPIIIQESVPIYEDDTEELLSQRILMIEHKIYPKAIELFTKDYLEIINNRKVIIKIK